VADPKKRRTAAPKGDPSGADGPQPAPEDRNALRSPSRLAGWFVLAVRFAVYITAALLCELLLGAYFDRTEGTDE
jgi:hypothetical protein